MYHELNNIMHYIFKRRRWSFPRMKLLNASKTYKLGFQSHNSGIQEVFLIQRMLNIIKENQRFNLAVYNITINHIFDMIGFYLIF